MIVEGYGIVLKRLSENDIELVRKWRNSKHINQFMVFRDEISVEQQQKWFASIDNIHNNYFIIEVDGKEIGLINGAQINWETKETGSGGIFIWEDDYWQTKIPIAASLLLTDTASLMGLERTYAKVLRSNKNAISFNRMLGYEILQGQEDQEAENYILETKNYIAQRNMLRKMLFKSDKNFVAKITIHDNSNPVNRFYIDKLRQVPDELKSELELILQ